MATFAGELRYALRQFWMARVFTRHGGLDGRPRIGGTTAIFTLMHAVMLRSLPVGDPSKASLSTASFISAASFQPGSPTRGLCALGWRRRRAC